MQVRRKLLIPIAVFWVLTAAGGSASLWRYALSPGENADAPAVWPQDTRIPRDPALDSLVVFLHPGCTCSRATVSELAEVVAKAPDLRAVAVFVYPPGYDATQSLPDLLESVMRIPGVRVLKDGHGIEGREFGAKTSGQALLFNRSGVLVYNGGMTAARGHAGDNEGRRAILAIASGALQSHSNEPVYGCPLFDMACEETLCHSR